MIDHRSGHFSIGGLAARELASRFGTPLYVYDAEIVRDRYRAIRAAFHRAATRVHFAAVCNPNVHLLRLLRAEGAGIHANTPGDAACALAAGFSGGDIVFSGSNASEDDLAFLVGHGLHVNVDSLDDLRRAVRVAPGRPVGLRIHVADVLPESRVGLREHELADALAIATAAGSPIVAVHVYCGTHGQLVGRYLDAAVRLLGHAESLPELECINLGGGFGYDYRDGSSFPFGELASVVESRIDELARSRGRDILLRVEPGRALVAPAGVLLSAVRSVKQGQGRRYIGLDTTVANFVSPQVHGAHRRAVAVEARPPAGDRADLCGCTTYSRDLVARDAPLPLLEVGDLVAILDAGAYGYCMAGRFLNRPRPAEVFVDRGEARLVTRRETYADLIALQA
ncbi:MAG: diaminopimelate decarboxylase family protein [Acidobacteriota bacterium]